MTVAPGSVGVHPRLVYALPIVLALALGLVTATAWWKGGPNLSYAYSSVGTGLVGFVVNPHNPTFRRWWYALVFLAIGACAATGAAMVVEASDRSPNPGAAFVACLAALAGLFVDSTRFMPTIQR